MTLQVATVRGVMHDTPYTVPEDTPAETCAEIMARENYRHLLVVDDGGKLEGVVFDLALFSLEEEFDPQGAVPDPAEMPAPSMPATYLMVPPEIVCGPDDALLPVFARWACSIDDLVVVVDEDRRPMGIITEHDVVRLAAEHLDDAAHAREFIYPRIVSVEAHQPRRLARALMNAAKVRHIMVTRDGLLVGVLSYRDVVREGWPRGVPATDVDPEHITAGDLVGREPLTVSPDAALRAAAQVMARQSVGCLPVVDDDGRPIGVISRRDLMIALRGTLERASAQGASVPPPVGGR